MVSSVSFTTYSAQKTAFYEPNKHTNRLIAMFETISIVYRTSEDSFHNPKYLPGIPCQPN